MRRYIRATNPGATFFFTVNLAQRRDNALLTDGIDDLRAAFRACRQNHPFVMDAVVVLPEHLHAIWTLPADDANFSTRWMLIKSAFSRAQQGGERISQSRERRRERAIWQRRFWEHQIRDDDDLSRHIDYVHYNPVKHGHVDLASNWPYSSIHRYIRMGWLGRDWAAAPEVTSRDWS